MVKRPIALCIAFFLIFLGTAALAEKEPINKGIFEILTSRIDVPSETKESLRVSTDGRRVYGAPVDSTWFVVVGADEKRKYDRVGKDSLVFSPDSRHVAYLAEADGRWFVVADGEEGRRYDRIEKGSLTFSPDSQHVAYVAEAASKQFVVVDANEKKKYDRIGKGSLVFSPDSKRVAYVAEAASKQFVVVDGKEEEHYDRIEKGSLVFSPDSQHLAYVAEAGSKWFVVADGKEGKHYNGIVTREGTRLVSRSFNSLSCLCMDDNRIYLVEVKTSPIVQDTADGRMMSFEP